MSEEYVFGMLFYMILAGVINILQIFMAFTLLILFLLKRSNLPILIVSFYLLVNIVLVLDYFIAHSIDPSEEIFNVDVIKTTIATLIWVPYFLMSERVKKTFVIQRKPDLI